MMPLAILFDEYIDRPQIDWTKFDWAYSSSPTKGIWNNDHGLQTTCINSIVEG